MEKLSANLTTDILSRLPVKSLFRFKSVSKDFHSYISKDPLFLKLHRLRCHNNNLCFLSMRYSVDEEEPNTASALLSTCDAQGIPIRSFSKKISIDHNLAYLNLLTSHHHLVCISDRYSIYICNPSTGEFLQLPPSPNSNRTQYCVVGFGYLPSKEEYKVIKLCLTKPDYSNPYNRPVETEILTITTPANNLGKLCYSPWRVLEEICDCLAIGPSVFIDGYLYWMRMMRPASMITRPERILSFDLEKEKFKAISIPLEISGANASHFTLAEIKGDVWLFSYPGLSSIIEMWVLKDLENHSWINKGIIDCRRISEGFEASSIHPVGFQKKGDIEDILFEVNDKVAGFGLMGYNLNTKTFSSVDSDVKNSRFRFCYYRNGF